MSSSGDILRGHTETVILAVLCEKDSYGYEIMKRILDTASGVFEVRDATIYTAFKRMEKEGLISTYWDDTGAPGARRKYYSITDKGRKYYEEKLHEWRRAKGILSTLIEGGR